MLEEISQLIDKIYRKKNYYILRNVCNTHLDLLNELKDYFKTKGLTSTEICDKGLPSKTWYIQLDNYEKGDFKVCYKTVLEISKLLPVFYIQHEFSVENKDINRLSPFLDGFDGQAYTKGQAELEDKICFLLHEKGYKKLEYSEINEVVEGIEMPEDITIFGSQVTVESILFRDVLDICNAE